MTQLCLKATVLLWALHLAFPVSHLQHIRWHFLGHEVPFYYFFTALPPLAAAAYTVGAHRRWSLWETLWWIFPLACLPGILLAQDRLWAARQWLSWVLRGGALGGVLLLTIKGTAEVKQVFRWVYPLAVAAALFGLLELAFDRNPLCDAYAARPFSFIAESANPFYRTPWSRSAPYVSPRPMGTQGNRIPYAACLVPFLPIGLWRMGFGRRKLWGAAFCAVLLAVLLSQTRGGWVGMAAALVVWTLLSTAPDKPRPRLPLALAACLLLALAPLRTLALGKIRSPFDFGDPDIEHRLASFAVLKALKSHWLFGVGYGQYPTVYQAHYRGPNSELASPDDQYLRWLIETGLAGFFALTLFLTGLLRSALSRVRRDPDAAFYRALLAGWSGIAVTFLFFDGFYWGACNMTFWCFLGLLATGLHPR